MHLKIAAALAALTVTAAGAACAEDFVTVPLETTINAPADKAWPKISGYCLIGAWFKTTCIVQIGPERHAPGMGTGAHQIDERCRQDCESCQDEGPNLCLGTHKIAPFPRR